MTIAHTWRLLITPGCSGAYNMALDQTLLESYRQTGQPTLRFYGWSPPCLSIGLGQRLLRDVDLAACAARGIDVVRRPTGGRAILHDQELTYALVIATNHPLIGSSSVVESYRSISEALCRSLALLGVQAALAPRPDRDATKSAACFDLPGDYEITVRERKLVGSAQRRQQGVLLQHGSILIRADTDQLNVVLHLPGDLDSAALNQRLIALDQLIDPAPRFDRIATALTHGFEQAWSITLVPGPITTDEHQRALDLVAEKYGNWAWTGRR